jgi:hypothetical protein
MTQNILSDRYSSSWDPSFDYEKLQRLLSAQQWKAADRATLELMWLLSTSEKSWSMSLTETEINGISCEDLCKIDQLWLQHSSGHFGFSTQLKIYKQCQEDWDAFGSTVGWRVSENFETEAKWIWNYPNYVNFYQSADWYDRLIFNLSAPVGHLPILVDRLWVEFDLIHMDLVVPYDINVASGRCLLSRLETCCIK